jgi:hypothetical protein
MKRIAPLEAIENKNPNNEELSTLTYECSELAFSDGLKAAILKDNIAFFYNPRSGGVKSILQKSLKKNNILINEEKHFLCNYRNALEVADKIVKQNFTSVFYVIDHSNGNFYLLHKKDKLFSAISEKFENILIVIINNNLAQLYED